MGLRVHELEVVQEGVRVGQHPPEPLVGHMAAGVDVHTDAVLVQPPGEGLYIVHVLGQNLAAGEGHAPAGLLIEHPVLLQGPDQVPDLPGLPGPLPRAVGANVHAGPALAAGLPVRRHGRPAGTHLDAFPTAGAPILVEHQLPGIPLALRVVAPEAGEGTALEKHRGADARAVVDRVLLDVQHQRSRHVAASFSRW